MYSGLVIRSSYHSLFKASTSGLSLLADFANFSALGSSTATPVAFDKAWHESDARFDGSRSNFAARSRDQELSFMHLAIFSAQSPTGVTPVANFATSNATLLEMPRACDRTRCAVGSMLCGRSSVGRVIATLTGSPKVPAVPTIGDERIVRGLEEADPRNARHRASG